MPKPRLFLGIILVLLGADHPAFATLVNGDFSDGFNGWMGQVTNLSDVTTNLNPPPGPFTGNFDASTHKAVLRSTTLENGIWAVFLFQQFVLDTPAPGKRLQLTYELSFLLSNENAGDTAFAQLTHGPGLSRTINLLGMSRLDVTDLRGQTVELLFGLEDFDDLRDEMMLDNVAITAESAPMPEPGTAGLLALGAGLLLGAIRR